MRKRISCRVVRSVPLGKGGDALQSTPAPPIHDFRTAGAIIYTRRLTITRTRPDDAASVRTLDLYV